MTTQEILDEIRSRAGDNNLQDSVLLTKVNAEYDQTNLAITNLNEDYFYEEDTITVTSSVGPYLFPTNFVKIRGLFRPDETMVAQRRPTDRKKKAGWYLAGTTTAGVKQFKFTDTPDTVGSYICAHVALPPHLTNLSGATVDPLWPEFFHEILILGGLERLYSVEDIWEKHGELLATKKTLREDLLGMVGGLNLGANRDVAMETDDHI
jgi:hypothetical protein